jgi:DNA-binding protein YbaB
MILDSPISSKAQQASAVTVVAFQALQILEIRFEPSLLESGDTGMIQDLTAAAVNAALTNAQRMVQEAFQRAAIGIQLPGSIGPGSAP